MIAPEDDREAGAASVINADEPPAAAATSSDPEPTADSAAPDAVASAGLSGSGDAADVTSAASDADNHEPTASSEQHPHTSLTSTPSQAINIPGSPAEAGWSSSAAAPHVTDEAGDNAARSGEGSAEEGQAKEEERAAAAMEALSLAAAQGAAGGSVPFGFPQSGSPTKVGGALGSSPLRGSVSPSRQMQPQPQEGGMPVRVQLDDDDLALPELPPASKKPQGVSFEPGQQNGVATAEDGEGANDVTETGDGGGGFILRDITQSAAQSMGLRGDGGGSETGSDWGSVDERYPMTPGGSADHHARLTGQQLSGELNAEGETVEEQLQRALARIVQLEDQNVALWEEMQQEGSEGSEGGEDSPTAEGSDATALEGGGSGRSGRRGKFLQRANRFSQEAMDAKEDELKFLQQRCMQFEEEVEREMEDLHAQLFRAQQQVHAQQQQLNESEAKRRQTEGAKLMVEAQLQETGQQLMECEALLVAAGQRQKSDKEAAKQKHGDGGGPVTPGGSDTEGVERDPAVSPDTPPARAVRPPFFNNLLETEMEGLKEENEQLMAELVLKKMALAELSESYARVKRDLHRREAKDRAVSSKMSRMNAILGGESYLSRSSKNSPSFSRAASAATSAK